MEIFSILVEGRFILYRPLLRLAFVGNQAMSDLVLNLAQHATLEVDSPTAVDAPQDVLAFLNTIGFLKPDPPSPPEPEYSTYPTIAVLLLTNRCNLRCIYCYASGGEGPTQELALTEIYTVIDRVYENAVKLGRPRFDLTFHGGGEPVQAWAALRKATDYARSKSLPCHISAVSNGVWSKQQREWILHNLNGLTISFDGTLATQDLHRPLASGRGSFKAVMRTIEALDRTAFSYGIRMTATAPWRGRLPEDVRYICENTGCQVMQVEPAFNIRRGEHQGPTREEGRAFVAAFLESFEIANRAGRQLTYSGARPWLVTQVFCNAPYGALIVNAAGQRVACYEVATADHPLAKLSHIGYVEGHQVVEDQVARAVLMAHLKNKHAQCRGCFCYWHCAGDCYTRSYLAQAAADRSGCSRCEINREISARILLWYVSASGGMWQGHAVRPQEMQLMESF